MRTSLTIGSRASKLALTQSRWVADALRRHHPGLSVNIVEISTTGDQQQSAALTVIGGKGAFTKELEEALLDERCDLAVHSLKDLPTTLPPGLEIACTPEREDTDDVAILAGPPAEVSGKPLSFLAEGSVVGTSSLRRRAQLALLRPDLRVVEFRGNVDTRLRKLRDGVADACILAAAGLRRLGVLNDAAAQVEGLSAQRLAPPTWLPAVGQGALALEARSDWLVTALLAPLHHEATMLATRAEREFLNALGAGCNAPVGALATVDDDGMIHLSGCVLSLDGSAPVPGERQGRDPAECGRALADTLIAAGAGRLLG